MTAPRPLAAAAPDAPLSGDVTVPGDKSISHRALILGALATGETVIRGLLAGHDVRATAAAMQALGAGITEERDGTWRVAGFGLGGAAEPDDVLDFGNSGTGARLTAGVLATHPIVSVLTGDASLRRRPMRRVTVPLAATGARFLAREGGLLPVTVEGTGTALPIAHRMTVASAQVKSALLLAGLNARGLSRIEEPVPTRDHTERMLRLFGAEIVTGDGVIELAGQPELRAPPMLDVPGDISSAAFPLVAALLVPGSRVTLRAVGLNPLRTGLLDALRAMGAALAVTHDASDGEPRGTIVAEAGKLHALDLAPGAVPTLIDEIPILAVACAASHGRSRLRGLRELRVKESDRLQAVAAMLAANGVAVAIEEDDLVIEGAGGPPPGGGLVATHMDHRIAMSGLVLGLASRAPVRVDDTGFIETSFPGFVALMEGLGARFA